MGAVFLACDARLAGSGRFVALKRVRDEHRESMEFAQMFADEARIAARIRHPNVVSVVDYDASGETPYIAMELLAGETLSTIRKALSRSTIDPRRRALFVARVIADACEGLHAAHELCTDDGRDLGLVHRDVAPDNLLLTYDGVIKLVDFGVLKADGRQHQTRAGLLKGKLGYVAPELLRGQAADRRADIWSIGVVLWELLTLERLFQGVTDAETLNAVRATPIRAPSRVVRDLPAEIDAIVTRALCRDPARRYERARDLARALSRFIAGQAQAVGSTELSELMALLFPCGRRHHARLLRAAVRMCDEPAVGQARSSGTATVATRVVAPVTAVSPALQGPTVVDPPSPEGQPTARPTSRHARWIHVALVGTAIGLVGAGGGALASRAAATQEARAADPPADHPPPVRVTAGSYVVEIVQRDSAPEQVVRIQPGATAPPAAALDSGRADAGAAPR
jgi:serine/threonine-protein kinase